jgi:hypothetical protein
MRKLCVDKDGYLVRFCPEGHPRSIQAQPYIPEHILIAERALGHHLAPRHVVHHVDGVRQNNANHNLVICEDRTYHFLLHMRTRALDGCGNPDWRMCKLCRQWGSVAQLQYAGGGMFTHNVCSARYVREKARRKRAEELQHRSSLA